MVTDTLPATTRTSDAPSSSSTAQATQTTENPTGAGCGDGVIDAGEACDDGNTADGDCCFADCSAAGCVVPAVLATLQDAASAMNCSTVCVEPGTYIENVGIGHDVNFEPIGDGEVIIDAGAAGAALTVGAVTVTMRGFTFTNGLGTNGGGIVNEGTLTLIDSSVVSNVVTGDIAQGGGINNTGDLTLDATSVMLNLAESESPMGVARGGGVFVGQGSLTMINGSSIDLNTAQAVNSSGGVAQGGGIYASASTVSIGADCSVSDNEAGASSDTVTPAVASGGGIHFAPNDAVLELTGNVSILDNAVVSEGTQGALAHGGGILFQGGVGTISDGVNFTGNSVMASAQNARAGGGALGVFNGTNTLVISDATFFENDANAFGSGGGISLGEGGAIWANCDDTGDSCDLTLVRTSIRDSVTLVETVGVGSAAGGAVFVRAVTGGASAVVDLQSCLVSGNEVEGSDGVTGGFAHVEANGGNASMSARLTNTTISGNIVAGGSFRAGGGIFATTGGENATLDLEISSCTFTLNSTLAGTAGAIGVSRGGGETTAVMRNTMLMADNASAGPECIGSNMQIESEGYNIIENQMGCALIGAQTGDQIGISVTLSPLADNGGPTQTHAISAGAAVDAGDPSGCVDGMGAVVTEDQRGENREAGGRCDVGAYELQ